jgi:acyl transferase domain-containing protein
LLSLLRTPGRVLLEVGPGTTLATLARQHDLAAGDHLALSSLPHPRDPQPDSGALLATAGRLWLAGAPVAMPSPECARRVPLPGYPFARQRCWYDLPRGHHPAHPEPAHPEPGGSEPAQREPATGPDPRATTDASSTAETIAGVWRHLLGVDELGPYDNFFELGGHSLLAMQIVARLREPLGVELPPSALFEAPTIAALTDYVNDMRTAANTDPSLDELLSVVGRLSPDDVRAELRRLRATEEPTSL